MEKTLQDVLSGAEDNYLIPFFWQHGETAEMLRQYMQVIHQCNIRAVCVESRPHPDYVGAAWWRDMDVILDEAAKLNMKVWVLDDAHFPTGYCNGEIPQHPEFSKLFLDHYTIDVLGPNAHAAFSIRLEQDEALVGVVAAKRTDVQAGKLTAAVDITHCVQDELVQWAVPDGYWNVIVLKTTKNGNGRKNYCNLIDAQAVRFFLDTVYEPHWLHYKKKFGGVFAGFFSDEPELGNTFGESPNAGIGQPVMPLPWCDELSALTHTVWGKNRNICLAALWSNLDNQAQKARYEYMNMVTDLYGKNFCGQVGAWCGEHGVEYIGHVIEDNGNHARTGYGAGHFYKALWGQHMSGIDVVLQQIRPGYDDRDFYHIGGKNTYDGLFFHYGLAKMGSSLAQLDSKKKGRTMCELFGAYGWVEGLKLMKWLADHMLVRGVNWFVPHAFTPAAFPDQDCPPHFYAQGMNPQFSWFGDLMQYINRMSHLLNGGAHIAKLAVLYSAELEWMGECPGFQYVGRVLTQNQVEHDVVPIGMLEAGELCRGTKTLRLGTQVYEALIVPECESIPQELANWIRKATAEEFPVLFAGNTPKVVPSTWRQAEQFYGWRTKAVEIAATKTEKCCLSNARDYKNDEALLMQSICKAGWKECETQTTQLWLRCYHYRQQQADYYVFFNEHPCDCIEDTILLRDVAQGATLCWYDAWDNRTYAVKTDASGRVQLRLCAYQTSILCVLQSTDAKFQPQFPKLPEKSVCKKTICQWTLCVKAHDEMAFGAPKPVDGLFNVTKTMPRFSGTMKYTASFLWSTQIDGEAAFLDCGEVFETLEVWLNGEKEAVRIAPPYHLELKNLRDGENEIICYVTNTLVHKIRDSFSVTMPIEASGLLGPVQLFRLRR